MSNKKKFVELLESKEIALTSDDIEQFLSEDSFENDEKEILVNHTDGSISLLSHFDISDKLQSLILDYHLDKNEIPQIIKQYNVLGKKARKALIRLVDSYVDDFVKADAKTEGKLFDDIMHADSSLISNESKVSVLTANISKLTTIEIQKMLHVIDDSTYGRILKSRAPKVIDVDVNHVNDALFEALVNNQLIKNYDIVSGGGYLVERIPKNAQKVISE